MVKKLFVSGRISGNADYKAEFEEAKKFYEEKGYLVMVPSILPAGMENKEYARICLAMIDSCDEVAFLPFWWMSPGSQLEHSYCKYIGKPIREFDIDRAGIVYEQIPIL